MSINENCIHSQTDGAPESYTMITNNIQKCDKISGLAVVRSAPLNLSDCVVMLDSRCLCAPNTVRDSTILEQYFIYMRVD
jgi:hypothetical protein